MTNFSDKILLSRFRNCAALLGAFSGEVNGKAEH